MNPNDWDYDVPAQQPGEPEQPQYADAVEEVYDEVDQAYGEAEVVISEAEKRIEQANLYQTILRHNFFAPGSARPEILEQVQREFREFARSRLENLLGMGSGGRQDTRLVKAELPFDDEQVEFLKSLSNRALKREAAPAQPQLVPVTTPVQAPVPAPIVNPIQPAAQPAPAPRPRQQARQPQQRQPARPQQQGTPRPAPRRRKTNNSTLLADDTGKVVVEKEYSQAVPPVAPNIPRPKRMPTQMEANMMAAAQASNNLRTLDSKMRGEGGGQVGHQLTSALAAIGSKVDTGE
jgi:hypothetical protein